MKKYHQITLLLFAPIALWAQTPSSSDIDLSAVAIVEEEPAAATVADPAPAAVTMDAEPAVEEVDAAADDVVADAATADDVVADAAATEAPAADEEIDLAPADVAVVDIPEAEIDGVMLDIEAPEIPEVETSALPSDSEIVLQLPGQEAAQGAATMAEEETISVDFPDEDVRTILRNVADLFDLNVVIPDTLQGRTSIKLRNITWRQVYEVVLEPLGFTYVEDRNIIRIKSIEELVTEPVDTRVFILNYANAAEIQGSIAPLIDPAAGGRIQVDARSNALVITERPSRMNKIQEIIDSLDRVTDQVMIESKFIEVRNNNDEDIGIDWAYINDTPGNLLPEDGAISGNPAPLTPSTGGLVAVFSRNEFAATLTALQQQDRSNLVSNPTVVVMNNQKALFQVGEDYPIREFSVNDQTGQLETGELEYRFTGIELDVTPTVNAAGMITLDVHPVVSEPGETVDTVINGGLLQDRIFLKRDAKTQVTIKDGYTIALGGLSRQKTQVIEGKIPFFGDLPFVGRLFSHNIAEEDNSNLIIFLTAKTLNPDGSTYADVIDPRQLEAMKLTPDQLPGYQVPQHELDMINAVEAKRMEDAAAKFKMKMDASLLEKEESFPEQTWTPVEWERGY